MKKNYTSLKLLFVTVFTLCFYFSSHAQIRMDKVDPVSKVVTIHNYGTSTVNVSGYWFCHLFAYSQLSSGTLISGSLNLAAGAEVEVQVSGTLNSTASDLGIYSSASFGSATAMTDFTQWGSGGNGRENVAVAKGIWGAGDFVTNPGPFNYTGSGTQNGVAFWQNSLTVEEFENTISFSISPNPVSSELNITIPASNDVTTIRVYDILGKQMHNVEMQNQQYTRIDVASWNTGVYLIKVGNKDASIVKRFVKQ